MKVAVYPGSFNPWHGGHQDILEKSLKVFDKVIIAKFGKENILPKEFDKIENIEIVSFEGLLPEFLKDLGVDAVIRGLRNGMDLQYEQNLLYWYEDLGLEIPVIYFICDRKLSHISSSSIREIDKLKE